MRRDRLFFLLCSAPTVLAAQAPTIPPGSRVRIETQQKSTVAGVLLSQTADSMVIASLGAPPTVVMSGSVARIRVSDGRSHGQGALRGLQIGTAVGAGTVALIFGTAYAVSDEKNKDITPLYEFVAVGALQGAILGVAIGALVGAERWITVYSGPARVGFLPDPSGRPGVRVSIRF